VLSVLATLIRRAEKPPSTTQLPARPGPAGHGLGFTNFFKSWLFLAPCVLFFLNLGVCAVDRISGRLRRKAKRRFGPDLVHVGLLVMIVGPCFRPGGARKAPSTWGGDSVDLPMGYSLRLLNYAYERYEDGRPRDWISTVEASRGGQVVVASYPSR